MILVDTCVLKDVFDDDPNWSDWPMCTDITLLETGGQNERQNHPPIPIAAAIVVQVCGDQ